VNKLITFETIKQIILNEKIDPQEGDEIVRISDGKTFTIIKNLPKKFIISYNNGTFGIDKEKNEFKTRCPINIINNKERGY